MAANLVSAKLWSQKRGMDRVGVDDPETEADIIREERTDAAMFPADVMTMAQLMGILQSLGVGGAAGAEEQAAAQAQSLAAYRQQLGGQTGTPSMNGPGEQAQMPPEGLPSNTEGSMVPPAPAAAGELQPPTAQVQTLAPGEGEAQTRLVTKQNVPLPPAG
jgi:hypothetical protein